MMKLIDLTEQVFGRLVVVKRIEDYGIELVPIKGHSVKIPAHGYNNGYYGTNIDLIITNGKDIHKIYDISECQDITD